MTTVRIFVCLSVACGLLGCRNPTPVATDDPGPPATLAEPPPPGPLNFEQVITLMEAELGAAVYSAGSHSLGHKDGVWRDVVVFRVEGEDYCRAVTPEAKLSNCEFVPGVEGIPWSAEEYLGLAVVAYTDHTTPEVEHLRMLERGCQAWSNGTCAEDPGRANAGSRGGPEMTSIRVDRLEISDIDLDGELEIELVTTYVELGAVVEEELGDEPEFYSVETFTRRRLTVLRDDLSRQLDVDMHQVMFEWIPGGYADDDVVNERYELSPDGATVSWCAIDSSAAFRARECWEQVCASPTARVRFPYDAAKDLYTDAPREDLRPVVEHWDGCSQQGEKK